MMVVGVKGDITGILKDMTDAEQKQVPYATALALTRTAQYSKNVLVKEIDAAFDRPTPYTRNALFVKPATKADLVAEVRVRDFAGKGNPAVRYLLPEVEGGARRPKAFENLLIRNGIMPAGWFAIPASGAQLDAYGNVPGSLITKILSQLQASRDSTANEPATKRTLRNRKQRAGRYFAVGTNERGALKPGIYERLNSSWHGAIRAVFVFTRKAPHYRKRYRFYEIGADAARGRFPTEFRLAMDQAVATAR
jgi:hypothetical protein